MKTAPSSLVCSIILFGFLVSITAVMAQAQGVPMGGCKVWQDGKWVQVPCSDGGSGSDAGGNGGEAAGRRARGWLDCKLFGKGCPAKTDRRKEAAYALNEQGIEAHKKGDWATAASYFEQALKNSPDDPVIKQNVANARVWLANYEAKEKAERDAAEAKRRDKAAADNMQQSIQNFAKTLNAAPSSGGLDFDGGSSANPANGGKSDGLDFTSGDTKVVDARKVPSGLPKSLDDAIAVAYRGASPEVIQRVRRGFEAVMNRDWNLAKAYFQDALNRDPTNANLKNLVKLSAHDKDAPVLQLPTDSDVELLSATPRYPPLPPIYMLGRDGKPIQLPDDYRGEVQTYLIRKDGSFVAREKPSDLWIMFPGLAPSVPPAPVVLSDIPTYRMDKGGNLIEVPDDYDGQEATYQRGKDGKLMQMPKPSDVKLLFPGTDGDTTTPASAPEPKNKKP